jgi:dTDP-4-dehydrorhamnose reductase
MFLIVGGDGEVGRAVASTLRAEGEVVVATSRRAGAQGAGRLHLDLDDLPANWAPPAGTQVAVIAAAVARLAACEADPIGSARVNVAGTLALTRRLAWHGIYTLYLSTNQVFDGTIAQVPATAPTNPVSAYGRQKAAAEAGLRKLIEDGAPTGILRLSKVVSPGMQLLADWRETLAAGRAVRAFADMTLAPVPIRLVVCAIMRLLTTRARRIAQLSGPRDITYLEAARHIAGRCGADPALVAAGRAADLGLPAGATPAHTTLDCSFLSEAHGIAVPDAIAVMDDVLQRI